MQIDLRTVSIKPLRQTFDHIAAASGGQAGLALPGGHDGHVQADANFHYRPPGTRSTRSSTLAAPHGDGRLVRASRTRASSTTAPTPWPARAAGDRRGRLRLRREPRPGRRFARRGACATPRSTAGAAAPCGLGRQHEQRLHLRLRLRHRHHPALHLPGDGSAGHRPVPHPRGPAAGRRRALDEAKQAWLEAPPGRACAATSKTPGVKDWFELFVAQNVVLDGLLYPLVYETRSTTCCRPGRPPVSMLTQFMTDWFAETPQVGGRHRDQGRRRRVPENKALLSSGTQPGATARRGAGCRWPIWPSAPTPPRAWRACRPAIQRPRMAKAGVAL
jgi:phenol hydroxylase P1 protein